MTDFFKKTKELHESRTPFVEVVVVETRGSVPSVSGSKVLVTREGLVAGTIGGGNVEARALQVAQQLLAEKKETTHFVTWNLQTEIGMTCGGEMKIFFHCQHSKVWTLAVFGAGHVAQSLVPLLCTLDAFVYCIDSREDWLDQLPNHSRLRKVCCPCPADFVDELPDDAFFMTMTQGHATDVPILQKILAGKKPFYVGAIGSTSKAKILKNDLLKLGIEAGALEKIHCPIGLRLGNSSPAEIAISVTAELLSVRDSVTREGLEK